MEEIVKTGKYYKIFSMKVNGIKYYFVGSIAQTIARNENWEGVE